MHFPFGTPHNNNYKSQNYQPRYYETYGKKKIHLVSITDPLYFVFFVVFETRVKYKKRDHKIFPF